MKKILYFLLLLLMPVSVMNAVAAPDWTYDKKIESITGLLTENVQSSNDIIQKLLTRLEIIGDYSGANTQTNVKRADFMASISAILNISIEEFERTFLAETTIKSLADKTISMREALAYAVAALGFVPRAESSGEYPVGYIVTASSMQLTRGLSLSNNTQPITIAETNQLLYNIISVDTENITEIKNGQPQYDNTSKDTILHKCYDVIMRKGIVTAAGDAGLFGESALKDNRIEIDKAVYDTEDADAEKYIGQSVIFFVKGEVEKTVIAIEADNNEIVSFNTSEIEAERSGKITVKNRNVKYNNLSKIILNGMYCGNAAGKLSEILSTDAEITAIDNNDDGECEVFVIWHYEQFVSKYNVGTTGTVSFSYGAALDGKDTLELKDDIKRTVRITKDKKTAAYTDILVGNAISVAKSTSAFGKEIVTVNISDKSITGIAEEIGEENGNVYITVNGEKYKMSEQYKKLCGYSGGIASSDAPQPRIGKVFTFLLTSGNVIAGIEDNTLIWGCLIKAGTVDEMSDEGMIRIFTAEGKFITYDIKEEIDFFDSDNMQGIRITGREAAKKILSPRINNPDYDIRTMVRYTLNSDDELTSLYLPYDNTAGKPGSVSYPNTYDFITDNHTFYHYKFMEIGWGTSPDDTLFIAPGYEKKDDEDMYRISHLMTEVELPGNYTGVRLYGADKFKIADSMLMIAENSEQLMETQTMRTFVIDKIVNTIDTKDEDALKIYGWENGMLSNVLCYKKDITSQERNNFPGGIKLTELKRGDIIQFIQSSDDSSLYQFRVLLREQNKGSYRYLATNGVSTPGSEDRTYFKYYFAYAKFNGSESKSAGGGNYEYINYSTGGVDNTSIVKSNNFMTDCIYYMYDSKENKIKLISLADLRPGDNIAFAHSYFNYTFVVVYK